MFTRPVDQQYLREFWRQTFSDPASGITPEKAMTQHAGRDITAEPEAIDIIAAQHGGGDFIRTMLQVAVELRRPTLTRRASPGMPSAPPLPPGMQTMGPLLRAVSVAEPAPAVPGPELLCHASRQLPAHAMQGSDGHLYDRHHIHATPYATGSIDDHTMTGVINAWREHQGDPARRAQQMRVAAQCPITLSVPKDPAIAADGFTYDGAAIATHLERCGGQSRSPVTNAILPHQRLRPNVSLQRVIVAHGLTEADDGTPPPSRSLYLGPQRMRIHALLPEGPHRDILEHVHRVLAQLYALAPLDQTRLEQADKIADAGHAALSAADITTAPAEVRRVAQCLRIELYVLTQRWTAALQDLDALEGAPTLFSFTRRDLALQAIGQHDARNPSLVALHHDYGETPELLAIMGETLRHSHTYAMAEQILQHSLKIGATTAAHRSLHDARQAMYQAGIRSTPMSDQAVYSCLRDFNIRMTQSRQRRPGPVDRL